MAYINEYISKQDFEKYNIDKLMNTIISGKTSSKDWTIDRNSGFWLYHYASGFDKEIGFNKYRYWYFFWQNHLINITTKVIDSKGQGIGQHYRARHKIISIDCPLSHEINRDEMLLDFQAALSVFGPSGMSGRSISSIVTAIK